MLEHRNGRSFGALLAGLVIAACASACDRNATEDAEQAARNAARDAAHEAKRTLDVLAAQRHSHVQQGSKNPSGRTAPKPGGSDAEPPVLSPEEQHVRLLVRAERRLEKLTQQLASLDAKGLSADASERWTRARPQLEAKLARVTKDVEAFEGVAASDGMMQMHAKIRSSLRDLEAAVAAIRDGDAGPTESKSPATPKPGSAPRPEKPVG